MFAPFISIPVTLLFLFFLCSNLQYTARRSSMADGPDSLVNFLKLCVCRMSADQLSKTLSRRAGGQRLLERAYQMEFYRASSTLLPKDCCISADVNMVRQCRTRQLL
jgi:hypothetical protein